MNPELEALLKALQAAVESRNPSEGKHLRAAFEALLKETAERQNTSTQSLRLALERKLSAWMRAQTKTSSLPPKA